MRSGLARPGPARPCPNTDHPDGLRGGPQFLHMNTWIVPLLLFTFPISPLKSPVVTICTTCFSLLELCILHTECICVFRMVLTINSDCFPKQQ
jgi:hypothetical protein